MEQQKYKSEWCLLQNQFESYEKHSLYIKLLSILVLLSFVALDIYNESVLFILIVLWMQDAIWKTFQSRIEPRLLQIEQNIREEKPDAEFQFNSEYQKVSNKGLALIVEYARQAMRPTVAFPHVILIIVYLVGYLLGK